MFYCCGFTQVYLLLARKGRHFAVMAAHFGICQPHTCLLRRRRKRSVQPTSIRIPLTTPLLEMLILYVHMYLKTNIFVGTRSNRPDKFFCCAIKYSDTIVKQNLSYVLNYKVPIMNLAVFFSAYLAGLSYPSPK